MSYSLSPAPGELPHASRFLVLPVVLPTFLSPPAPPPHPFEVPSTWFSAEWGMAKSPLPGLCPLQLPGGRF